MRGPLQGAFLATWFAFLPAMAQAVDHNNIDEGRSLRFEDASSIAFHERSFEVGLGAAFPNESSAVLGSKLEIKYGFALNMDASASLTPSYETGPNEFSASDLELSFFHAWRREIGNSPALAYRIGLSLPTGRDASGVDGHTRVILSKALRQYDKIHLNLDGNFHSSAEPWERDASLGAVLGYTMPIGYPRSFTQTLLAEFAVQQSSIRGEGWTGTAGVGIRKQVGVRSVADLGIESDVFVLEGSSRVPLRIMGGLSWGF